MTESVKQVLYTTNLFSNNRNITSVNLNNATFVNGNMTNVFCNCNALTQVTNIGTNVVNMARTFYGCSKLTSVPSIPNTVTNMYETFSYCNKLTNIPTIPESVTNLASTFEGCNGLTNIQNLPNTITDLSHTFEDCNNLTNITIPNSVTSMYGTFCGCKSLATPPTIPNSVTYMGSTFENCTGLTSYPNIPNHIHSYQWMFSGCTQFTSFYQVPEGTTYMYGMFSGCNNMSGSYNIPNTVTDLGYCFNGCTKLSGLITIPENTNNCYHTFQSCTNLTDIIFNCKDVVLNYCCNNCTSLRNATFNCENIRNTWYAFKNCNSLTNVNGFINNGNLGWAFNNLKNLKNVNLTIGTIQNGSRLFSNCTNLSDVNISVNSINNAAYIFNGCTNLTRFIDIPGATNLEYAYANVSIPTTPPNISSNVKYIDETFENCFNLTNMPNLSNCTNLTSMGWTFSNCTNLRNVTELPNSITTMRYTFSNCTNLTTAPNIPENVIQTNSIFYNCQNLTGNIYISSSNIIDGSQMFNNTSLTKNVYIPYTYSNGIYTSTYNTLSNEYTETGSVNGVYLKPNFMYLNMSIPSDSTLYVNGDVVVDPQKLTIREDTDYTLIKEGFVPYIKHITYQEGLATDSIVDADLSTSGVTLTISPTQSDAIIEFTYLGITSVANSCTVASGTEVIYKVKKSGYKKEIQTIIVTEDTTITVTLEESEIPTTFGSRIGNIATVVGTFTDNSGRPYVYAVLDSIYRNLNASDYLHIKNFDPEEHTGTLPSLPIYGEYDHDITYMTTDGNIESATYNTDGMIDYYKDYNPDEISSLDENYQYETIYHIARNAAVVTLDGEQFKSQLPNTYELNQIWQNKTALDEYDPTLLEDSSQSLTSVFDENRENLRVWSSTLGEASYEIELWGVCKRWDDPIELTVSWAQGNGRVVPIFEIPLD